MFLLIIQPLYGRVFVYLRSVTASNVFRLIQCHLGSAVRGFSKSPMNGWRSCQKSLERCVRWKYIAGNLPSSKSCALSEGKRDSSWSMMEISLDERSFDTVGLPWDTVCNCCSQRTMLVSPFCWCTERCGHSIWYSMSTFSPLPLVCSGSCVSMSFISLRQLFTNSRFTYQRANAFKSVLSNLPRGKHRSISRHSCYSMNVFAMIDCYHRHTYNRSQTKIRKQINWCVIWKRPTGTE